MGEKSYSEFNLSKPAQANVAHTPICPILFQLTSDRIFFYLYIYPPDSQESDGGAIHRVSNYPDLLLEMPRYCCPLVI